MSDIRDPPSQALAAFQSFANLVHAEIALAKAEIARHVSRASVGIAFICVAALLALVALNTLAGALVGALAAQGIPLWLSALAIGTLLLVLAGVFVMLGRARLKPDNLKPSSTTENLARDIDAIKEATHV